MKLKTKTSWLPILAAVLLVTQACALVSLEPTSPPPPPDLPAEATVSVETSVPPTESAPPIETTIPDPASACPTPGEGNSLYLSRENGFCFLYPVGFTLQPDWMRPDEALSLIGPAEPGEAMEKITVSLSLAYNGPNDGLDSAAYAGRWLGINYPDGSAPGPGDPATIGGAPAVVVNNLYGPFPMRVGFVVANGIKYSLMLVPQPEMVLSLSEPANLVWNTVAGSLVFFPPENTRTVVRAADVCPAAGADTLLYQNDRDGYCYLYPSSFTPTPDFPGQVVGGPVVLANADFGEVRTSLTLGTFGYFPGQTPRQVLEPRGAIIDSLEDTSMGGHPAVIFRDPGGPWVSKQALIMVDSFAYTIVAQPFEPEAYPDGMPYLNQVWDTVTGSLAFFEPFK